MNIYASDRFHGLLRELTWYCMDRSPFTRSGRGNYISYESSIPDSDISFVSSGRPSVDRMFPSMYDDMDSGTNRLSTGSDFDVRSFGSSFSGAKSIDHGDYSFSSQDSGTSMSSSMFSASVGYIYMCVFVCVWLTNLRYWHAKTPMIDVAWLLLAFLTCQDQVWGSKAYYRDN